MAFVKSEAPDPPDYAKATKEGIQLDIDTLPIRRLIDQAARAGAKIDYKDPITGEARSVDFTGMGDADLSRIALDFGIESQDKLAAAELELSKKYGIDFINQRTAELKAADPTGYAMREEMGGSILADLQAGKGLDDATEAEVVQAERSAQAARGNMLGSSSAAAEAMEVGNAGFRLWQQKLANAASFLSGVTPTAQFSGLSGAQAGATPSNMMPMQTGISVNPNAGAEGWSAASQRWGMAFQKEQYDYESSPWTKMFDMFNSMLVSAAGTAGGVWAGKKFG